MDKDLEFNDIDNFSQKDSDRDSDKDSDNDSDNNSVISSNVESETEEEILKDDLPGKVSQLESQVDDYEEDFDDEMYLQKFDSDLTHEYICNEHEECLMENYNEILTLSKVVRNSDNIIIDDFHKTIPILTKYEKTRILGQRTKQLNEGSNTFIPISESIIDNYIIAEMELKEKKLPFIIRRPIPNGSFEYWKLEDLELL